MRKITKLAVLPLLLLALSACGKSAPSFLDGGKGAPSSPSGDAFHYLSQTVPVSSNGSYDTLDIKRYSKMHLVQSSYLFQ